MLPVSVLVSCPDTVLMIDTVGTFNAIKAAYEVYMKVSLAWLGMVCCTLCAPPPESWWSYHQYLSNTLLHWDTYAGTCWLCQGSYWWVGRIYLSVCVCLL